MMGDEELLNEALECIYEIRGAYLDNKFPEYERHKYDIDQLSRVTSLLETRLGRNNHAQ